MNTNSKSEITQQVPLARRGFLSKAGAAALAVVTVAAAAPAVAAPQAARAIPAPYVNGVFEVELVGEASKELAELCKMAAMLGAWLQVNRDVIQSKCPELELELNDYVEDMGAAAKLVTSAAGFTVNPAYVAKYREICVSMRGAA